MKNLSLKPQVVQIKTNILFAIIKKDTKNSNTSATFLAIDIDSKKILSSELFSGSNSTKSFKIFIAITIVNILESKHINKIYIPTLAKSATFKKFLLIASPQTEIELYKINSTFNSLFINIKKHMKTQPINNVSNLEVFVNNFNGSPTLTSSTSTSRALSNINGKRNYSTLIKMVPTNDQIKYGWFKHSSNKKYEVITEKEFTIEFNKFLEYYNNHHKSQYLLVLPKIMFKEGVYRSISTVKLVDTKNSGDTLALLQFTLSNHDILSALSYDDDDSFTSKFPRGKIVFNFKEVKNPENFKNKNILLPDKSVLYKNVKDIKKILNFKGIPVPQTMDLSKYEGISIDKSGKSANFQIQIINNNDKTYNITAFVYIHENTHTITFFLNRKDKTLKLFSITDTANSISNPNSFKRDYYEDGILRQSNIYVDSVLKCNVKPQKVSYIRKLQPDKKLDLNKICTLDIETKMDLSTNKLIPICMSMFIKNKCHSTTFSDN